MALLEGTNTFGREVAYDPKRVLFVVNMAGSGKDFSIVIGMEGKETLYLVDDYKTVVEAWEQEVYGNTAGQAVS